MSKKIKKFFHTTADMAEKCRYRHPDGGKYRAEPTAEGAFPAKAAQEQPGAVTQPDVTPADRKAVNEPEIAHDPNENQVRQMGMAGSQGPQRTVAEPQPCPKQHPNAKAPGGKGRARQPSRRPQRPPLFLGCS